MNIDELHSFQLSDAVKFHDELNPALWTEKNELDPEVHKQLLIIAKDFLSEIGVSSYKVEDITISGSNAAYSYTPHSDLDLHILVDFTKLPDDEIYRELFNAKKTLYNDAHDIKVHGVPVELYVQDSNQPHYSLGEYSLLKNDWIKIPKKRKANFDQAATKLKYEKLGELIELALRTRNIKRIEKVLDIVKRYRKAGLEKTGEFGPENLAFKALRKQGLIQKLYDLKKDLHSKQLSIDEVLDTQPTKQHKAKWDFSSPDLEDLKFTASNGINYSLNFMDPYIGPSEIDDFELLPKNLPDSYYDRGKFVEFSQIGKRGKEKQGIEGTGAAAEVFGIVTNGILNYIKKKKPTYLYFQAAESNRQSLYSKMIKKILSLLPGWKVNGPTSDGVYMLYSMPKGMKDVEEDWHPNDVPPGPEFKPTMPKGTVRVDVSDVYDWYKLGQHISNMKGLGKHDFGKGPPSTILSFGDEDLEHQYIDALKKTGLDTTDIDPKAHDTKKGQKVDPTYKVDEVSGGAYTSWSDGDEEVTLQDILELTKHIKQIDLPIDDKLKSKLIHWDGNPKEIERINQVTVSNQFPILVMLDGKGQIDWILDGNHRLHKAIKSHAKTIPAKLIKPSDLDDKARRVFHINESKQKVVEGTNCHNCKWWKKDSEKPVGKDELNSNGGLKPPNKEYIAMSKRVDLVTLPGKDTVKVKGFCYHKDINDWVTERMCCAKWDASGVIRDYKGESPLMEEELEEASGYIPSEKEKNDPRFKTALTVDIKPDSIKKNAKALGFNISRKGIPPLLRK
jgi:hypothetical protein